VTEDELEQGSISHWLCMLKCGQQHAAEPIWDRYYKKLVSIASQRLRENPDRSIDGEDIVQSSCKNVFSSILNGKYPEIENRGDLWNLLLASTVNRVRQHYRELNAVKRKHISLTQSLSDNATFFECLRTSEAENQLADLLEFLLNRLDVEDPSGELRKIAILHLEDHSASSIARMLKRRKTNILVSLRWIRSLWEELEAK
jgi:hypothetical protein